MFAHQIVSLTGPDDVVWTEVPEPTADGGVIIDVAAAGVSFADLLQANGEYQMKVTVPYTPGMDAAAVIRFARPASAWRQVSGSQCCCRTVAGRRSSALQRPGCCRCLIT